MKTDPLELRRNLDGQALIAEARDLQHAVKRMLAERPDVVVADASLPSWDLHVLHDKVTPTETAVVLLDAGASAAEIALAIEDRRSGRHRHTPSL